MKPNKGQRLDVGGGVTVEYARRQGLVRVHGPSAHIELPLRELLSQLGVQAADICPSRHYLLFGGPDDRPNGGMGDLIDVYTDEQEAREAFQRLRLATGSGPGWAQLVALAPGGGVERLCWFSPDAGVSAVPTKESEASKRRWRARRKQTQPSPPPPPPPPQAPPRSASGEVPAEDTRPILAAFSSETSEAPRTYRFPGRPPGPIPPRGGRRRR